MLEPVQSTKNVEAVGDEAPGVGPDIIQELDEVKRKVDKKAREFKDVEARKNLGGIWKNIFSLVHVR